MSNGATNSPNFKTVRHNFQKVTGQSLETCNLGGDKNYTVTSTYL